MAVHSDGINDARPLIIENISPTATYGEVALGGICRSNVLAANSQRHLLTAGNAAGRQPDAH